MDIEHFRVILRGGDPKTISQDVLRSLREKWEEVVDKLGSGSPGYLAQLWPKLRSAGFTGNQEALEQLKFLGELRELYAQMYGAYIGEAALKESVGTFADAARFRIRSEPRLALGPGNRILAAKAVAGLSRAIRLFGDDNNTTATNNLTQAINQLTNNLRSM